MAYLQMRYTQSYVNVEFEWDKANIGHVARHGVLPDEAEEVILNDPVDLGTEIVEGEEAISTSAQRSGTVFLSW